MATFYIDSNFLLRFFLEDNLEQMELIKKYLSRAKKGEIQIVCLTEIVLELEYVLRKVYKYQKEAISQLLLSMLKVSYLIFPDKKILEESLETYQRKSIDLVDLILYFTAKENGAKVLSFDKDFLKI